MGVFVKICGMASGEDAREVAALGPDAMGFIFWSGSKRSVQPEMVAEWSKDLPDDLIKAGVFVDAGMDEISRAMDTAGLDLIQLHGSETPEFVNGFDCRKWKAVHLDRYQEETISDYRVDAFLVDSYSIGSPGGTGLICDWEAARRFVREHSVPVLLAGGLSPDNVSSAIREVQPWGVDVVSGVEKSPGRKDIEKVRAFIQACRNQ